MFKKKQFTDEERQVDEALTMLPVWKHEVEEWRDYTAGLKGRAVGVRVQQGPGDPTAASALTLLDMPPFLQRRQAWVRCLEEALEHEREAVELCNLRLWMPGASVRLAAESMRRDPSSISRLYNQLIARLIPHAMRAGLIA